MGLPKSTPAVLSVVFDFNRDDYPDFVFFNFYTNQASVFLNVQGNSFQPLTVTGLTGLIDSSPASQNIALAAKNLCLRACTK